MITLSELLLYKCTYVIIVYYTFEDWILTFKTRLLDGHYCLVMGVAVCDIE